MVIFISFMIFWSHMIFPYLWLKWTKAFLKLFLHASLAFLSYIGDIWVCVLFEGYIIYTDEHIRLRIPSSFSFRTSFGRKLRAPMQSQVSSEPGSKSGSSRSGPTISSSGEICCVSLGRYQVPCLQFSLGSSSEKDKTQSCGWMGLLIQFLLSIFYPC